MLTQTGQANSLEAQNDARHCSGYWGQCSIGGTLVNTQGYQLVQLAQLESRIRRGFVHAAEMLGSNHVPGPHIIEDACSAFHSALDILSAQMFDRRESLIEAIDAARDQEALD